MALLARTLGAVAMVALFAGAGFSQATNGSKGQSGVIDLEALALDVEIQRTILQRPERFLKNVKTWLAVNASDGVFRLKDLQDRTQKIADRRRQVRSIGFRRADKNSDGDVSPDEISARIAFLDGAEKGKFAELIAMTDKNEDENVSASEIEQYLDRQPDPDLTRGRGAVQIMSFDLDGNKEVDAHEVARVVRAVVAKRAVTRPTGERAQPGDDVDRPLSRRGAEMLSCGYPEPSRTAEVVAVTPYAGLALSDVALADTQHVTTVTVLEIEEGDTPIYLFAGSTQRTIFELRGAVHRVEQVVAGFRNGIVGLARQRVYFAPDDRAVCDPFRRKNSKANESYAQDLAVVLVQERVKLFDTYKMGVVTLPAGEEQLDVARLKTKFAPVRRNRKQVVERAQGGYREMTLDEVAVSKLTNDLRRRYPAAVHQVDASAVVARFSVAPFQVLPAEAGLIALIQSGGIRNKPKVGLTIVRALKALPVGLGRIGIRLETGVPLPRDVPETIFIKDVVSGDCLSGPGCPRKP